MNWESVLKRNNYIVSRSVSQNRMRSHFPRRRMWDVGGKRKEDSARNREEFIFFFI